MPEELSFVEYASYKNTFQVENFQNNYSHDSTTIQKEVNIFQGRKREIYLCFIDSTNGEKIKNQK